MTQKLIVIGMLKSNLDTCIFICDKFICMLYVDDLIFWAKDKSDIRDLAIELYGLVVYQEQEEDSAVFMGINL